MTVSVRTWWRRWRRLAIAVIVLQSAYSGSYASFYYRGVSEADAGGFRYFFYVPVSDVMEARGLTRQHVVLGTLYEPLNELHMDWFGGRSACRCVMFGRTQSVMVQRSDAAEPDHRTAAAGSDCGENVSEPRSR